MLERRRTFTPRGLRRGAFLLLIAASCAKENLAQQLPEGEANEILVVLSESGLDAEKIKNLTTRDLTFDIHVAKADALAAYRALRESNLPKKREIGLEQTLATGGIIPTTEAEMAKHKIGVQGDLANKIRTLPGVVDVKVEVSIPKDDPLRDVNEAKERPKASVIIVYQPTADNEAPMPVEAVQNFVQASLPALKRTDVTVHMMPKVGGRRAASVDASGAPVMGAGGCETTTVLTVEVCAASKSRLRTIVFGSFVFSFALAGLAVVAVLRALRYRKDLTRLTAQFNAQGRK